MAHGSIVHHSMGYGLSCMVQSFMRQWVMGYGVWCIIHFITFNGLSLMVQSFIYEISAFDSLIIKFVSLYIFGMIKVR